MKGVAQRNAKRIAATFAVALLALSVHNLVRLIDNQRHLPCGLVLCQEPRDIEQLCQVNSHTSVWGQLSTFYFLGQRIPGATLTIPPWMADHRWHLERVSRLRVVVSDAPMVLDPDRLARVDKGKINRRWLRSGNRRTKRVWQWMTLVLEGAGTDYVLAETSNPRGRLYLISTARYRTAQVTAP